MSAGNKNATSASLLRLVGRKHKAKLGADLNESVATGPSDFARKQLEKLGWTEGTGLGKNRDGRSTHIRVTKRREGQAIGAASTEIDPVVTGEQWWKSSVGNTLARLAEAQKKKKKKKSSKKDKKDKKIKKKRKIEYTDEELFEATGGARFGMRAQTQQKGKWNRAEDAITKDEEEMAIAQTEWDGMAAPKIVLSAGTSTKAKVKTEKKTKPKAIDKEEESSSSSKPPKRKKRRISSEETNTKPDASNRNNNKNDDNEKDKPKKEKKNKKSKKEKKKKKSSS